MIPVNRSCFGNFATKAHEGGFATTFVGVGHDAAVDAFSIAGLRFLEKGLLAVFCAFSVTWQTN